MSVTLLGLPCDASSSFLRGPTEAPPAIRRALAADHGNGWSDDRKRRTIFTPASLAR